MRAAAYARYSTANQTENSIDTQLAAISRYCNENGHSIVSTYVDMAMSGTNTERPDFQRMIDGAKSHQFDCIVVYDISRASRDVSDWMGFRKCMRLLDIEVLSTTEKLGEIDDPNAFLSELLTAGLNQHMVLQTRQKSIAGTAQKAKQGVFLGGQTPLGYDIENGKYILNSKEAEAVKLIFNLYANGKPYSFITEELKKGGHVGKTGKPLSVDSIRYLLTNERYIGNYTWNKTTVRYMRKWTGLKPNPNVVRIENAVPQIIDKNTWERVQNRLSNGKANACNSAKHTYLLSGLIECGQCGGIYGGKTNKSGRGYESRSYICNNKYRSKTCNAKNINADEIETTVVLYLKEYFKNGDFDKMAEEVLLEYNKVSTDHTVEKRELNSINTKIANGTKAILAGAAFEELHEEIAKLKTRKAELEDILALEPKTIITKGQIVQKLRRDAEALENEDIERLIKSYVSKIYINENEIVITGGVNLSGDTPSLDR